MDNSYSYYYDLKLLDVISDFDGVFLYRNRRISLRAARLKFDQIGLVGRVSTYKDSASYVFLPYQDQTLRRAFEYDRDGKIAWLSQHRKGIFLTQKDFLPGEKSLFVPDESETVNVKIPKEFIVKTKAFMKQISELVDDPTDASIFLEQFLADLCGFVDCPERPREDGAKRQSAKASHLARAYFLEAFGINFADAIIKPDLHKHSHSLSDFKLHVVTEPG